MTEVLVANLVDNAIRHNLPGGEMSVGTAIADGRATLSVANTGRPITAREVDHLFQPFQRDGADRVGHADGHGLGLTIVRAIADAHDATLSVAPRPRGGLAVAIAFPLGVPAVSPVGPCDD
jgi:signal transduction histidine kinase